MDLSPFDYRPSQSKEAAPETRAKNRVAAYLLIAIGALTGALVACDHRGELQTVGVSKPDAVTAVLECEARGPDWSAVIEHDDTVYCAHVRPRQ